MQNICQCLKLKAAGGMSDLEHVTPSSAPRVFISLGPVYIKCHKLYVPFPAEDLRQTNGRSSLQKQTHSACWRRDKKKKKRQRSPVCINKQSILMDASRKLMFKRERPRWAFSHPAPPPAAASWKRTGSCVNTDPALLRLPPWSVGESSL